MINQNIDYDNHQLINWQCTDGNVQLSLGNQEQWLMNGQILELFPTGEQQLQQQQQPPLVAFRNEVMQYDGPGSSGNNVQQQQQHLEFANRCEVGQYYNAEDEFVPMEDEISTQELLSKALLTESQTEEDGKYAFLTTLNSGNLMQLSQQNVVQEMFKDALAKKPDLNVLPTLEEHDNSGYNFNINVTKQNGKSGWTYSEARNKLYIKINEIVNIDAKFDFKLPIQEYRIRAFLSFAKDVSEPVSRCQNHISKDTESNNIKRESLLRCENPTAEHCGTAEGKSIKDRLSVLVPVSICVMPNDQNISQRIALKFTCQNSCIGRRETCIVFLLEGMSGEILAQRILNVRICSCPKRDRDLDEKNVSGVKRKLEDGTYNREHKAMKREPTDYPISPEIKEENSCSSDYDLAASKQVDLQKTPSGNYRLVMEITDESTALSVLEYALSKESVHVITESKESARSLRNFKALRRFHGQLQAKLEKK